MTQRTSNTILGREIGTSTGWDEWDDFAILLYNFEPNDNGRKIGLLMGGDLVVDWDNGWLIVQADQAELTKIDMAKLYILPRTETTS